MTLTTKAVLALIITSVLFAGFLFVLSAINQAGASAPSGLPATIATTSTVEIGPQLNKVLFATSTCAARIVSTATSTASFQFTGALGTTSLTSSVGHQQAASTTVVYDSGVYGCGVMTGFAYSSSTVTISE